MFHRDFDRFEAPFLELRKEFCAFVGERRGKEKRVNPKSHSSFFDKLGKGAFQCQRVSALSARTSQEMRKRIYLSVPHTSGHEQKYVQEAFDTNWLSTVGPNITGLETEMSQLTGLPSVALVNGTAAMHLAVKLLDFK